MSKSSENHYLIDNEIVKREWIFEKNDELGLDVSKISIGSHKKAWWRCEKCGNEHFTTIRDRLVIYKIGCPYCAKKQRQLSNIASKSKGKKTLSITHPILSKEWVGCSVEGITPDNIVAGSNLMVEWECPDCHGHYKTSVANRTRAGSNCPFCAGQKVLVGLNDIQTTDSFLASEWSELNVIKPTEIMRGSNRKVYWKCPFGHEDYLMSPHSRISGQGCPQCAKESQTSFPEQAVYFYIKQLFPNSLNRYLLDGTEIDIYIPELKIGIEYNGYYAHKGKKEKDILKKKTLKSAGIDLWIISEYRDNYQQYLDVADFIISEKYKKEDLEKLISDILRKLSPNTIQVDLDTDQVSIYQNYVSTKKARSFSAINPTLLDEWDYERNGKIKPEYVSQGTNKKYYWICPKCHQSYLSSPKSRVKGSACPYCAGKKVAAGINDLESYSKTHPDILRDWDYEKNNLDLSTIYFSSGSSFNWKCSICGREYISSLQSKLRGKGCPYCNHKLVVRDMSFGYLHPDALLDWDYDKNSIDPFEVAEYSNKYAYWKCHLCGAEFKAKIASRSSGNRCKYCSDEKRMKNYYQAKVKSKGSLAQTKPLLLKEWNFEKNDILGIEPTKITSGSGLKVWWTCSKCGHKWEDIVNRRSHGKRCPSCQFTYYPRTNNK